ncbi:MAG: hypothetical protein N3A69_14265 [Leptospiraceae bacterium]|nr:hypothetical protein [Leptospiraceae bacterium]
MIIKIPLMLSDLIHKIFEQRDYLYVNLGRAAISCLLLFIISPLQLKMYEYLILTHLIFSLFWTFLYSFPKFRSLTKLGFIPQILDILVVTIFVMLTGHVNSFVSIGYVVIVVFTSIRGNFIFGKSAVLLSVLFYLISGILVIKGKVPIVNLFGYVTAIQWKGLLISSFLLFAALVSVNQAIVELRTEKRGG